MFQSGWSHLLGCTCIGSAFIKRFHLVVLYSRAYNRRSAQELNNLCEIKPEDEKPYILVGVNHGDVIELNKTYRVKYPLHDSLFDRSHSELTTVNFYIPPIKEKTQTIHYTLFFFFRANW